MTAAQFLALSLVSSLFVFTTFFELYCIDLLTNGGNVEVAQLAMNLEGMLVYPFIAYLIFAVYCFGDAIRFAVNTPASTVLSDH